MGERIEPWEVRAIQAMDREWLIATAPKKKGQANMVDMADSAGVRALLGV